MPYRLGVESRTIELLKMFFVVLSSLPNNTEANISIKVIQLITFIIYFVIYFITNLEIED